MAAGRSSNREIAQALFVSTGTVAAQLTQTYVKLAVHSRRELQAALGGVRPDAGSIKR